MNDPPRTPVRGLISQRKSSLTVNLPPELLEEVRQIAADTSVREHRNVSLSEMANSLLRTGVREIRRKRVGQ
jgi:hypothetical protein